jgi:hypothetical protein
MNRTQTVWIIIILSFSILYFLGKRDKKDLSDNKIFTRGEVVKIDYKGSYKGINFIYFRYAIGNDTVENRFSTHQYMTKSSDTLIGIKFPVIYNSENHKQVQALLYKWQFSELNIQQPDSLKWVNKYFGY